MPAKHKKIHSQHEVELRRYHKEVREFKTLCQENGMSYKTYKEADEHDICVLSRNEYELHDMRSMIVEDNESYFLTQEDYEKWCNSDI